MDNEDGKMKKIIASIIDRIPSGKIFDTHTIIEYLLQNDSDAYLHHYNGKSTELYHADIGKCIYDIADDGLVTPKGSSWSINIHKTFSECACWQKK
jgi:hypothetical protein